LIGVYQTINNGANWQPILPAAAPLANFVGRQGWWNLAVGIVPGAPTSVYLSGLNLIATVDGGRNWTRIDVAGAGNTVPHVDHHALAFLGGAVFDGDDGGIFKYSPGPAGKAGSWADLNGTIQNGGTLETIQVNSVATNSNYQGRNIYLEGSQDNGLARWTGAANLSWNETLGGDGGLARFDATGFKAFTAEALTNSPGPFTYQSLLGDRWDNVTSNGQGAQENRILLDDNTRPSHPVFAFQPGSTGNFVIGTRLVYAGEPVQPDYPYQPVWHLITPKPGLDPGSYITAVAYANASTIYVGFADGQVWKTTRYDPQRQLGLGDWTRIDGGFGGSMPPPDGVGPYRPPRWGINPVTSIVVDPTDPLNQVYFTINSSQLRNQVWQTLDAGTTAAGWRNASGGASPLPSEPVYSMVIENVNAAFPLIRRVLFVGNRDGVYYSTDLGTTWTLYDVGLPVVEVKDLQIDTSLNALVAGTYGRGVWRTQTFFLQRAVIEAIRASTLTLATFTDTTGATSFTASINWGDGTPLDTTSGQVSTSGTTSTLTGSHTFAEEGSYTFTATITDSNGSSVVLTGTIDVVDASQTATAATVNGTVGSSVSNVVVASFTDANASASSTDFTAIIDWGDNSGTSVGIVTANGNGFIVQGSHTYLDAGSFPVTVQVDDDGGSYALVSSTAAVAGQLSAQPLTLYETAGTPTGNVTVATMTDTWPSAAASDYTGTISWGDGQISAASFAANGNGGFNIIGSTTYDQAGWFPLTITVQSVHGGSATARSFVFAGGGNLVAMGVNLSATQSVPFTNVLAASFTDSNPGTSISDYAATIAWGDGNVSAGGILAVAGNNFAVTGSNTYLGAGSYVITVTITDSAGDSATANSSVSVNAAAPVVSSVSPAWGDPAGGAAATITGTSLVGATAVAFGGTAATSFTVNADGSITAVAPAHAAGTVDVIVTTPGGTSATSPGDQFSYINSVPTVSGLGTSSGQTGGGTSVTITGTNLAGATQVNFGNTPASSFTITSPTSIVAIAPAQLAGTVPITVTNGYGTSTPVAGGNYTYIGTAPAVTAVSPASGPTAGGRIVTITGVNLNGTSAVSFGGTAASAFTVVSATSIVATAPALAAGTVDITVTTPYGTSATSAADQFTAVPAPTVTGLSSTTGPTGGGSQVTITGTNLSGASQVYFGTIAAPAFTINSATSITVTAPIQLPDVLDVTVITSGGQSATSAADQYTYVATAPTVTGVSPNRGPTAGGTTVTITGANLNGASQVWFGSTPATGFLILSATQISATAPGHTAATVDVTVTTRYGTSATSAADQFTYANVPAPTITAISTGSGPMAGGTVVTLTGTNFTAATAVAFGTTPAASFTVNSDTQITATAPAQGAGLADITVTTPFGISGLTPADQFTYLAAAPAVTGLSVNAGSTAGGTSVTLSGSNLTAAKRVYFGAVQAAVFTVLSDGSISAISPVLATGTVDITVVTPWGTSATSAADRFTATAAANLPTVSSLSVTSGPTGGGTAVTITGTGFTTATEVLFGTVAAPQFTIVSDTSLTVTTPAATAGTVDVTIVTANGISTVSAADRYTYNATAPALTGITPASGAAVGGTVVVLTGTNFNGATQVLFGTTAAASFTVNSATSITATPPRLRPARFTSPSPRRMARPRLRQRTNSLRWPRSRRW
jgi:hypothetical protein